MTSITTTPTPIVSPPRRTGQYEIIQRRSGPLTSTSLSGVPVRATRAASCSTWAGSLGQQLADRAPAWSSAGDAADRREPVVDAQEAQVAIEQRDADRGVREHHVEQPERLAELDVGALEAGAQGGDRDRERRARRHGREADRVLRLEVAVLEQADQRPAPSPATPTAAVGRAPAASATSSGPST